MTVQVCWQLCEVVVLSGDRIRINDIEKDLKLAEFVGTCRREYEPQYFQRLQVCDMQAGSQHAGRILRRCVSIYSCRWRFAPC